MEKNLDITKTRYSEDILPFPWPSLYGGSTVFCLVFIHSSFTHHLLRVTLSLFLKNFYSIHGKSIIFSKSSCCRLSKETFVRFNIAETREVDLW